MLPSLSKQAFIFLPPFYDQKESFILWPWGKLIVWIDGSESIFIGLLAIFHTIKVTAAFIEMALIFHMHCLKLVHNIRQGGRSAQSRVLLERRGLSRLTRAQATTFLAMNTCRALSFFLRHVWMLSSRWKPIKFMVLRLQ